LKKVKDILKEIERLRWEDKFQVYTYLGSRLKRKEFLMESLEKIRGRGKNIHGIEPQEYINKLREDDNL
jgi:hypothetical protein